MSYLLRHKPETANLTLDKEGWCSVAQLMANTGILHGELLDIVKTDSKGRYSLSADLTMIRANQGHSTKVVDLTFKSAVPPTVLYHGTTEAAYEKIKKQGLLPMKRHHVHLSSDRETATHVGARRNGTVLLIVDAKQMLADGIKFFISENGVWLVPAVSTKYLSLDHK